MEIEQPYIWHHKICEIKLKERFGRERVRKFAFDKSICGKKDHYAINAGLL